MESGSLRIDHNSLDRLQIRGYTILSALASTELLLDNWRILTEHHTLKTVFSQLFLTLDILPFFCLRNANWKLDQEQSESFYWSLEFWDFWTTIFWNPLEIVEISIQEK